MILIFLVVTQIDTLSLVRKIAIDWEGENNFFLFVLANYFWIIEFHKGGNTGKRVCVCVCGKLGVESRSYWPVADAVPCGVNKKNGCRTLTENR